MRKFFINGTQISDDPDGELITAISRDKDLGGVVVTNEAQLNWHGDGYDIIQAVIDTSGYCEDLDVEIWEDCSGTDTLIFKGKVFITDIKKSSNCIITSKVEDNNYFARIRKNRNIKIWPDSTTSKNGEVITASPVNRVTLFNPSTGNSVVNPRKAYRVCDVLAHMIAFLSDGEVAFESNYFGVGGEWEGLSILTGQELAVVDTGEAPADSFDSLFKQLRNLTNCSFYIDTRSVPPVFRVEKYEDLFDSTIAYQMDDVEEVEYSVKADEIHGTILTGSDILVDSAPGTGSTTISFLESNVFQTFKREEYTQLGQCNTDTTLDLTTSYAISSNAIEDAFEFGNTDFEEDLFFIDATDLVASGTDYTSNARLGDPFGTAPPYFYNTRLFNSEVLERWKGRVLNSIVAYQGALNNKFRAQYTSNTNYSTASTVPQSVEPWPFDDDFTFPNYDGDGVVNNYGNGTTQGTSVSAANSRYTVPAGGKGDYNFYAKWDYRYKKATPYSLNLVVSIKHYDSGGTQKDIYSESVTHSGTSQPFWQDEYIDVYANFTMEATDYAVCTLYYLATNVDFFILGTGNNETYFTCTSAPDARGEYIIQDNSGSLPIVKAKMDYPIEAADYYTIEQNAFKRLSFTYPDSKIKSGWIDKLTYNHTQGFAEVELIGTKEMLE